MTTPAPSLHDARLRHDGLIDRLRKERQARGLSPVEIPPQLAGEIAGFTAELRAMGASLYNDTERSATLSLMSYWINALYRAEWYQSRNEEPPSPELANFAPDAQPPLEDADYPWPRCDRAEMTPESSAVWQRLSEQGVEILKQRRLLGVTGVAGCGRSNLIDTGLLPALRKATTGKEFCEHVISPSLDETAEPVRRGVSSEGDLGFLSALLPIAQSAAGTDRRGLDEMALGKDPAVLARLLDASGRRHLVVVHDLHQLFMLSADPSDLEQSAGQRAFMAALTHIASSPAGHCVIVDIQISYLARLRMFEDFHRMIDRPAEGSSSDGWLIVSLENDELRRFITDPAKRIGLHFEAGLVDRLMFEHQSEPAAATLLLFTLRRLWADMLAYHTCPGERRNMITWQNYRRVGSGRLVLEIAADEATKAVLDPEVSEEEKDRAIEAIRLVFVELVRIMPGSACWLATVPKEKIARLLVEAGHPTGRIERILSEFIRVGLFIENIPESGAATIRIFHDAVIGRWTRLVQWIEEKRTERRTYWLFRADARDWNRLRQPSPAVRNAGWWARTKDALLRLHSRQSRLWRGSKLREVRSLPDVQDLNRSESDFLRVSRRVWVLTIAVLAVGIASIPVAIIIAFMLWEAQQRSLNMALFMDRGLNLVAEGDPGSASLWLAEVRRADEAAPLKRFLNISSPSREAVHKLSIGMAFRRMPDLQAVATVADGLISTDISPSGRYALLGCRKKGDTPGRAILWTLGGESEQKEELQVHKEGTTEDFSFERVAFAKWADDQTPRRKEDTLMAVGGSVGGGMKGVVFVRDVRKPGQTMRFDFDDGVRDLAFFPGRKDEPWRLAVAFGDETKQPARGGVEIIEMDASRSLPTLADLPVPGPATRLAVSGNGRLAVASFEPKTKTWRVHVFTNEKEKGDDWKSEVIEKIPLPITDLALSKDGCTLAIATANSDSSAGSAQVFTKVTEKPWVEASADAPLQLGSGMQRVEFNPDGHSLLGGAANGVIGIWSLDASGKATLLRKLTEGGWTYSAAWSPDGRWIATGNRDRHARLWDASSGRLVLPPLYQGGTVSNVRFTLDGLHLLTNTVYAARLWSTAPNEDSLQPVQAVERRGSHALLSEDGQRVAVASVLSGQARDGVREADLALWELNPENSPARDGRLRRLPALDPIAAGPDAGTLAARAEAQKQVPEESLLPMGRLRRLPTLDTVASSPDGRTLAALTEPQKQVRRLLVWNTTGKQPIETEVNAGADFLGFVPGSPPRLLVAGALTSPQRLLSAVALISPEWLPCAGAAASIEVALADGRPIVGFIQLFDVSQPKLEARLMPLEFRVKACAASKDGKLLAIGGDGGESPRGGFIGVLDVGKVALANGRPVQTGTAAMEPISRHLEAVTSLAFSPRADWLLSGSIDDHVKLFKVDATSATPSGGGGNPPGSQWVRITPTGSSNPTKHTADLTSVGFSHDGLHAATTGRDSMAILWAVTNEGLQQRASLDHRGVVSRHAFSADDRWLATGGDEGARLWSLKSDGGLRQGELVATLPHRFPVVGIAFRSSSDSASGDLCTLAHERASADPANPRAVEAHRWSLAPKEENPAGIQGQASLLAGRRLDIDRLRVVDLSGQELEKRWAAAKDKRDPLRIDSKAHLSRAAAAAAAGDWDAAAMHLRELPGLASPGTDGGREDVLRFAVDIFAANQQPEDVFRTIEKLEPESIADPEIGLDLMEKRGEACIQVARATGADANQPWLERAEKDFRTLAEKQPGEGAWRTRRAEIRVLRGELREAIALLEESKRLASAPTAPDAGFVMRFTAASQDQRIAAIRLLLSADAQGQGDRAEASRQREQWEQLVRQALDDHKGSKLSEKGRVAWPAVLGEPQDTEVIRQALAFAEEGYRDRPDSYGRVNTYATALLRAGKFPDALLRLDEAIELYEREREPLDRGKPRRGRPVDWVVRALILHGQSTQKENESQREKLLAEARDYLKAAEDSRIEKKPQSQITWRATWNNLDLQVLLAEAERKLNREKRTP